MDSQKEAGKKKGKGRPLLSSDSLERGRGRDRLNPKKKGGVLEGKRGGRREAYYYSKGREGKKEKLPYIFTRARKGSEKKRRRRDVDVAEKGEKGGKGRGHVISFREMDN